MGFWYRTIIQSNNDKRPSIIYFVEVVGVDAVVVGVAASPDIVKEASNSSNRRAMSSNFVNISLDTASNLYCS